MGMVATAKTVDFTGNHFVVRGTIALSGSYPGSGHGDVLSFGGIAGVPIPTSNIPDDVRIYEAPAAGTSASGLQYNFSPGTTQLLGKVQLFGPSGGGTPAGTIVSTSSAPTITTGTNATVTAVIATNGGALTQAAGATGITGVQAPTITSVFTGTAGTGSGAGEIGNVTYASLNIVNLSFTACFSKNPV